jgi:preprotein translocase subunit SecA
VTTARPTLSALRDRYATAAGDLLWDEGERGAAQPSRQLRLLATHREEYKPIKLDEWGAYVLAQISKLARPLPRFRRMAKQIIAKRSKLENMDEVAFAAHLTTVAENSRLLYSVENTRTSPQDLDAFAAVSEAVRRINGFRPHPEQLIGALGLLEGSIVEMATGEGKTITASMGAIVSAWRGQPCHVVTSNDYLAARDCEINQTLFALCTVSAASLTGDTPPQSRGAAYQHDIVYTTAQNFLADHLRDDLALKGQKERFNVSLRAARAEGTMGGTGVVQTGVHQVIVDEADSVLIDEAVTPLIISAPHPDDLLESAAVQSVRICRLLEPVLDYTLDQTLRTVELTKAGRARLHTLTHDAGPFWQRHDRAEELVHLALYASHLMHRDEHYVVEDEKVVLVDELTGRLARSRTLSLGMQQVLEASLDIEISPPSEVRARLSFQRYFRRLPKIGGMTGTAQEARGEFASVYGLKTVPVPTHKRVRRQHMPRLVFRTQAEKMRKVAQDTLVLADAGRAVLIGVRSVHTSAALHAAFSAIAPDRTIAVLNAVNDAEESQIVEHAGISGAITVATNMAGRGTDIKIDETVGKTGGLHVIIAETNDFGRIDRQLIGRCARQGDPGTTRYYISMDEELMRRFLPKPLVRLWSAQFQSNILRGAYAQRMVRIAQRRAERLAYAQRKSSLESEIAVEKGTI